MGTGLVGGGGGVDESANYTWTGTHEFQGATTFSGSLTSSDVILGDDGAVGTPAYSFAADTNTGIYRPANDRLSISVGGTEIRFGGDYVTVPTGYALGWGTPGSEDTSVVRIAAGIVGIEDGTGSALATLRISDIEDSSGNQVVGSRGAAVTAPSAVSYTVVDYATDGATIKTHLGELQAAVAALRSRMITHGLISA